MPRRLADVVTNDSSAAAHVLNGIVVVDELALPGSYQSRRSPCHPTELADHFAHDCRQGKEGESDQQPAGHAG